MAIGLTEEHEALAASVRGLGERHLGMAAVRTVVAATEAGDAHAGREVAGPGSGFWTAVAGQGLLGLHLPEEYGGQGFTLVEQAVALEALGRLLAPGPYLPTVLAGALIAAAADDKVCQELLPGLADGTRTAAVALEGGLAGESGEAGLTLRGRTGPVLGAGMADVIVLSVRTEHGERWAVVDAADVEISPLEGLDLTRAVGAVAVDRLALPNERVLEIADAARIVAVVLGAEACGVAGWAVEQAAAYARSREQFGRPIGQFQGVKHKVARMLIALERARAVVWDAARAGHETAEQRRFAGAVAAAIAPDAGVSCAEGCIQVHGGIGYTFEHEAHLYYRRALALRALTGRASIHRDRSAALTLRGLRRPMSVELADDAGRAEIRAQVAELAALDAVAQRAAMAEGGWVTPHLPRPWGRDASPQEQIIIQQELARAGVRPVPLMIAAWAVPSLVRFGTEEQKRRFLPPTLRGEIIWCQLFSEPGAGSDLAGLTTKAERTEGGWLISGQKIWTSLAREAQWGICIARSDPQASKHEGITYLLVDMASEGIEIRPLRECTGDAVFNEVFLDQVFVPDELVVGPVNAGWRVARNTLANERVGLTSVYQLGGDVPQLVTLVAELALLDDPLVRDGVGRLAADEHAFHLLGLRATLKQLSGTDPGATANVRKLVAMEHGQDVTEFGFGLLGAEGALTGDWFGDLRRRWTRHLLASRAMTIGGGTTEVNLNVIAERILGLPRDAG